MSRASPTSSISDSGNRSPRPKRKRCDSDEDLKMTSPTSSISDSGDESPRPKRKRCDSDEDFDPTKLENSPKKTRKVLKAKIGSPKAESPKKQVKVKVPKPKAERPKKQAKVKAKTLPKEDGALDGAPKRKKAETKRTDKPATESSPGMEWDVAEYLASLQQIHCQVACNIIRLLDEENTIPFIARYRKELTGDMSPEKLREVKESYEMLECVKQKANTVMNSINKLGKLTPVLERSIRCSRTLNELDHIYAPFKPGSKRTLAERARQLGLEAPALAILDGSEMVNLIGRIQAGKEGLSSIEEVESGVQHIIADVICKDRLVLEKLRQLKEEAHIKLESSKARASVKPKEKSENLKGKDKKSGVQPKSGKPSDKSREDNEHKFENYFNFSAPVKFIKPHQVLAINRGENLKILSVKILIPDWVMERVVQFCFQQWLNNGLHYPLRRKLVDLSVKDAYTRLMHPLLVRQVRSDLNQSAVRAAVEVFATNLKNLLLSPPLRGSVILGIDPGFRNGCKIALTSQSGEVLHTDIIYPRFGQEIPPHCDPNACKLKDLLTNFNCQLVAVGNGTACRETESYLSYLIQSRWFSPLDVTYTIVSEQGASIYSCSPEAKKEFPDLDANLVSAVSLARRVQDPLGELVKVEPKHLGVGMYQHDVPEKQLSSTLEEVVVECVSFVGVDINTASQCILQRVAGLNQVRANNILQWRASHSCFYNRQQLLEVKGIGPKTFQQCAGFIRIIPETTQGPCDDTNSDAIPSSGKSRAKKVKVNNNSLNPLDRTWIHPESYSVATNFIEKCGVNLADVGKPDFIKTVNNAVTKIGLTALAAELNVDLPAAKLISDGLQQAPGHDLRTQFSQPLFRRGLTSISDLTPGTVLTGRVQNVTHFGVFVDIGVGINGLIPASRLRNMRTQLGDRVEVKVISKEEQRKRIALDLIRVL